MSLERNVAQGPAAEDEPVRPVQLVRPCTEGLDLSLRGRIIELWSTVVYVLKNICSWCLAPFRPNVERLASARDIKRLTGALKNRSRSVRKAAANALGEIGDVRAVEPLISVLQHRNTQVRLAAAGVLGVIGNGRAVQPLIAALRDKDRDVRWAAGFALERVMERQTVEPVIAALHDENELARRAAARALGKIGDAQAVDPLIQALQDGSDDVRKAAAQALGRIQDPRAVAPLVAALRGGYSVRSAAAEALGSIKDARTVHLLIPTLQHADKSVRETAVEVLGEIGETQAVPPLLAMLHDKEPGVREAAVGALGHIGDAEAVPPILAMLRDANNGVRGAAAKALGQIGDTVAVKPLVLALKDKDQSDWVREAIGGALRQLGWQPRSDKASIAYLVSRRQWNRCTEIGAPAITALSGALKDEDPEVRRAAAEALGQIGHVRAVKPLSALLDDEQEEVRAAAQQALSKLGWRPEDDTAGIAYLIATRQWDRCVQAGPIAVMPLCAALQDRDVVVRWAAAGALGKISDARAVGHLIACVDSPDLADETAFEMYHPVIEALAKIGPGAVEPLIAVLRGGAFWARSAAVQALGQIADARTVEPLLVALAHADDDIARASIVEALGRIGDNRAVEPLVAILDNWLKSLAVVEIMQEALKEHMARRLAQQWHEDLPLFIVAAAPDESPALRKAVVEALGKVGDPRAVSALRMTLISHYDSTVRCAATVALGEIGDPEAEETLAAAVRDKDRAVRSAAAVALERVRNNSPEAWCGRGLEHYEVSDYQEAARCFRRAIKLDPQHVRSWYHLGLALDDAEQHDEALRCYEKTIGLDGGHGNAWNNKGRILHRKGRRQEAIACFETAVRCGNAEAKHNLETLKQ